MEKYNDNTLKVGTLRQLVSQFKRMSKRTYTFVIRSSLKANNPNSKQKYVSVHVKMKAHKIPHFTGLEHIGTILNYINNGSTNEISKDRNRRELIKLILSQSFSELDFNERDKNDLNTSLSPNFDNYTQVKYTLHHRIQSLLSLEKQLESSDISKEIYIFENWTKKASNVPADLTISIPSEFSKGEKTYIFCRKEKQYNDTKDIEANIISIFPEALNYTRGNSKPHKAEAVIITESQKEKIVYMSEEYKQFLKQETDKSLNSTQPIVQNSLITNTNNQSVILSPSGAAVLQAPTAATPPPPPTFDELKKRFTKLLGKVKAKLLTLSAQAPTKATQTKQHTSKKSSSQKRTTNAKNKSSNSRASAQKQTAPHTRSTNAKRKSSDSRSSVHIQSSSKNASQQSQSENSKPQPTASKQSEQARTECPDKLDNQQSKPERSGRFGTNKKEMLKIAKAVSKTPRKSTQTKSKQKNDPSLDD